MPARTRPTTHLRAATVAALAAALAACGGSPASSTPAHSPARGGPSAVFANGDFDSGSLAGWTVEVLRNPAGGVTYPPQSYAQLNLVAPTGQNSNRTSVKTGATDSIRPPVLSASATLRVPRYGTGVALVNEQGASNNVNSIKQTMTTSYADVDPADGKVHVRFAVAPVLQNPSHNPNEQPYFWVQLRNVTKNVMLFQTFNFAGQTGVPWKLDGGVSGTDTIQYTDWKSFDISPGPAQLAVGDQVEMQVIAAGCSRGGHWGEVYVDAFGPFLPGLSVTATAPQQVNSGSDLAYTLAYSNSGPGIAGNVVVKQPVPAGTTFKSASGAGATCTTPAVGASSGTVSCSVGALNPAAGGTIQVTFTVTGAAGTSISNGSYTVEADAASPLIGPLVTTAVTSGVQFANLSATVTDGLAAVGWGETVTYTVTVSNAGPAAATGARLQDPVPANVASYAWSCVPSGGASCAATSGSGSIDHTFSLPAGGSVVYTITAVVVPGSGSGTITHLATVSPPTGVSDPDTTNDVGVDQDGCGTKYALTLTKGGAGTGRVVSAPAGLDCNAGCTAQSSNFLTGTTVALTATASPGHAFSGWGGACSGTASTCSVPVTSATAVTASFAPPSFGFSTSVATPGTGTLTCPATVVEGQPATCTVTPAPGYVLSALTDNGANVTASVSGGQYAIASVTGPHALAATFAKAMGTACGAGPECAGGICADGVCCDGACTGQCESCNLAGKAGTCSPVSGAPAAGHAACSSDGSLCGGTCDGAIRTACAYPAAPTECRGASCAGGTETLAATCDGAGACPPAQTRSCGAYACGATACGATCLADADCAAGHWCDAGACAPKRPAAAACAAASQCASGFCADAVCCDGACGGQCEACNLAGTAGTCSPASGAPAAGHPACASDGTACGGTCDGSSRTACAYPSASTSCRAAACSGGVATLAASCAGAGACPPPQTQPCGAYACGATACLGNCATDGDCAAGNWCAGGLCTPKAAGGASCGAAGQCASGFCVDGVCCNAACDGQCEACAVAGSVGTCAPVTGAPAGGRAACASDGSACAGTCDGTSRSACAYPVDTTLCRSPSCTGGVATLEARCAGTGSCPAAQVQPCGPFACGPTACAGPCAADDQCAAGSWCSAGLCTPRLPDGGSCGAANQCQSGFCTDGTCCNAACNGQCEACDVAGAAGTCSPVTGAPRAGRAACASDATACAGTCDGSSRTSCAYPGPTTTCRDASCTGGVATLPAACDGAGACPPARQQSCGSYACGPSTCAGACSGDGDCAAGNWCSGGICVPRIPDGGSCGAAGQCASGFCVDGVCCNAACDGQCEACDVAGAVGTCSPSVGAPRGARPACAGDGSVCGGACGGASRTTCAYPGAATSCRPASCASGVETHAAACDGAGACPARQESSCGPYACGETACGTSCTGDAECAAGSSCSAGTCVPSGGWHVQGSGCGSGGGGAAWPSLLALAFLPFLRRRRERGALLLAAALALPGPALAQEASRSFPAQRFLLAPGADDLLSAYSARTAPPLGFSVALEVDYASEPLVLVNGTSQVSLVSEQWNLQVTGSIGILSWLEVGVVIPATLSQGGEASAVTGPSLAGWTPSGGFGDPRIVPRARLLDLAGVGVALALPVSVPLGTTQDYVGWDAWTVTPTAIVEWDAPFGLRAVGNLGFTFAPQRTIGDLTVGDSLAYRVAGAYGFRIGSQELEAMVVLDGAVGIDGSGEVNPLELLAALRWFGPLGFTATLGGGPGLSTGYGTPSYRALAMVSFAPWSKGAQRRADH